MKAAFYDKYGTSEVFKIASLPKPKPKAGEVLVKVICTTVNRTDVAMTSAAVFVSRLFTGLLAPNKKVPGTDFAGVIEDVGVNVTSYEIGDRVFGFDDQVLSSQAEYLVIEAEGKIASIPSNTNFQKAVASIEGAHYAINMYNKIRVKSGDHVMVNGGTGAIGSSIIQLLKTFGVRIVATADTQNVERIKGLGAYEVYDYLNTDFTKMDHEFDYVLDTVGKSSFKACRRILKPKGIYISSELGKNGANLWWSLISPILKGKKVKFPFPSDVKNSLALVSDVLEKKAFHPMIDREFPLDEIREAYAYVASGQKKGNVILTIQHP